METMKGESNMQTVYQLRMPPAVFSGEDALAQLQRILQDHHVSKAAVFTDKGIVSSGLLDRVSRQISAVGAGQFVLDDLPPEPAYQHVQKLVDRFRHEGADLIVAVGGGSVMDTAKLASILGTGTYTVKDLLDDSSKARKEIPSVMIPTTAGTGAEATPNAIVAVPEQNIKFGIVNTEMIADYVILDGEMIRGLPQKIAAATGVDALAHAIECFTSNKATPFSDLFALQALDLILNHIERACGSPTDMEAKNAMLLASFYAGVAITASGTTAVHALSYPLGGRYHIAHGVSNAILLSPVMRFNEPVCRAKFSQAYDRCVHESAACRSEQEKSAWLLRRMEEIVKNLRIPAHLAEFGVTASDLDALVEAGMGVTRLLNNNRRVVTPDDARQIYEQIL